MGTVKEWRYDSAGRIVHATFTPAPAHAPAPLATGRLYDGDTVLRRETRDTVRGGAIVQEVINHDREERGRIVARNGAPLRYDLNGNLIDDGIQQYVYDAWNRLLRVEGGGQIAAEYEYDALHRLIKRRARGVAEEFVYDGWEIIEVRVNGTVRERYVYSDQLDDVLTAEVAGQRYTVLYTPEGYVDALVDAQRHIVESYDYTLSGVVTVLDANRASTGSVPLSRFFFQRRPFDPVTGLYDYRMRWCHAGLGLFLTPDSSGFNEGSEHYGLNHGDTVNRIDPFGLQDVPKAGPDGGPSYAKASDGSYVYTWKEFGCDILSGLGLGLWANANQIPKVVSFGVYEGDLFGVPSNALDRMAYNYAVIPARIGQEAAFAAGTAGLSIYIKGAQGTTYGVRLARGTAVALTAGELASGGYFVIRGGYNLYQGEAGTLDIVVGLISLIGGGLGAKELKELVRSGRANVVREGLIPVGEIEQQVLDRSMQLRRFVETEFPGPAGDAYTFGIAARAEGESARKYISLNQGLEGIPWWEFVERGIVQQDETLVLTLGRAVGGRSVHAEASLIRHLAHEGGDLVIGASRHICPECTARLLRHDIPSVVPLRALGTNPEVRGSGMVQFLRALSGADEGAIRGLGRGFLEDVRRQLFPGYPRSSGVGFGGRFPRER